ncbi:MAG: DJ-1/PfpI family protein [Bacteroidetes bacterium]|nr:DJ-1/PfpI family protein [Bacteroidota bacterium]
MEMGISFIIQKVIQRFYKTSRVFLKKINLINLVFKNASPLTVGELLVDYPIKLFSPENVNDKNFSAIVLIGGKGSKDYWDNEQLHNIVKNFKRAGKIVAAICSAPIILARAGLLSKIPATCWSEDKNELINLGIEYKDRSIVTENGVVTADGPHSAEQFAETVLNMIK